MLHVGLIGLGPEWQQRYRPALKNLRNRLQVRSIYTPVTSQAEMAAVDLQCDPAPGIVAMAERDDIHALIVLDSDWHRHFPAWIACQLGKPAFLAGRLATRFCRPDLRQLSADSGVTLMPGLTHRYTPATSRLRELIATRLGRAISIEIEAGSESPEAGSAKAGAPLSQQDILAMAIDWCTCIIGTAPSAIVRPNSDSSDRRSENSDNSVKGCRFRLEFRRPSAGGVVPLAEIQINAEPLAAPSESSRVLTSPVVQRVRVRCAKGEAQLEPPFGIAWDVNGTKVAELLTSDRPEYEVMLDHFSRRVLGGLIPVPTLDDLLRAREFASIVLP